MHPSVVIFIFVVFVIFLMLVSPSMEKYSSGSRDRGGNDTTYCNAQPPYNRQGMWGLTCSGTERRVEVDGNPCTSCQ
jgi:hypothetical protein